MPVARALKNIHGSPAASEYLGPATVVAVAGHSPLVLLEDDTEVSAEVAFPFPYVAAIGDTLLVLGKGGRYYALGVLSGQGRTELRIPGDVHLHAVGGTLSLSADQGVSVRGPEVEVLTGRLALVAESAVQTFGSLLSRVRGLMSTKAKRSHTIVDEEAFQSSQKATWLTRETTTINGKQILLG